jgi:hypothetical protein
LERVDETTLVGFDLADDRDATNKVFKHTRGVGDKAGARRLEHIAQEVASVARHHTSALDRGCRGDLR